MTRINLNDKQLKALRMASEDANKVVMSSDTWHHKNPRTGTLQALVRRELLEQIGDYSYRITSQGETVVACLGKQ